MSGETKPQLALVEPVAEPIIIEQEVIQAGDPRWSLAWKCRELEVALKLAETDLRVKRAQITKLQRKKEAERQAFEQKPLVESLFAHWQKAAKHPRSKLTPERFDACRARIEDGYTEVDLLLSIEGIAFQPNQKPRRNGTMERYDDFEVCMRTGKSVEFYANRAPR